MSPNIAYLKKSRTFANQIDKKSGNSAKILTK